MGYNNIVTFLQDNNINFTVNEIIINSFKNIEINVEKAKLIIIYNQENKFDIYCTYCGENIKIYNASYQTVIQCIKDVFMKQNIVEEEIKMENILKDITQNNENITEMDLNNIIEMGQNYYKKEELTTEELTNTYKDYCFQWNIQ